MGRLTGWLPDRPDRRDHRYKPRTPWLYRAVAQPHKLDLPDANFPPVFDQGNLGSCVFNGVAESVAFAESTEGNGPEVMSRLALYFYYRRDIGQINTDSGSTIRDGIKTFASYGAPLETLWPYDVSKFAVEPPADVQAEGAHRKVGFEYARVDGKGDMIACLAEGFPIVFGTMVFPEFLKLTKHRNIVPMPRYSESPVGGHCMVVTGYDLKNRYFRVRNSWGPGWGDGGYCRFRFEYLLDQGLADDFWTIRKVAK